MPFTPGEPFNLITINGCEYKIHILFILCKLGVITEGKRDITMMSSFPMKHDIEHGQIIIG